MHTLVHNIQYMYNIYECVKHGKHAYSDCTLTNRVEGTQNDHFENTK